MVLNTGDTAWILAATALVMLMTPGVGFFYGGMVRKKNVAMKRMITAENSLQREASRWERG
jgi:ammonia channel protein AmtB